MKSARFFHTDSAVISIALVWSFSTATSLVATTSPAASLTNPNPTHETAGEGISDTAIMTSVKANLLEQKDFSSTHVHVRTREGVVRLTTQRAVEIADHTQTMTGDARGNKAAGRG
ncbi:hypothetical protein [Cupriavidus sp. RAF12]|uniref:hypothetical protein n=1 Tax=Cupriavidus sp. RAF12 TaxID=3233050 RepID=UPI003F8FA079